MKTGIYAAILVPFALAACAPEPAPVIEISERARAALPPGTNLADVGRRNDGCYYIQTKDDLSGYLTLLREPDGTLVCDDI